MSRSFLKPSLLKPVIILASVTALAYGTYYRGKKSGGSKTEQEVGQINSSGLDPDKKIETVKDVEEVMEKWVAANPMAIIQSVTNMQKQAAEDRMKNAQKNIGSKKRELFKDSSSPSYAPSGYNVTIVEFFDYSCGYCKKAHSTVSELLSQDSKVRVVYKEFPILGPGSEELSTVALAVNMIDPSSYKKFHDALMQSNAHSKGEAIAIAKGLGIDVAKLESALQKNKDKIAKIIQANRELGSSIGVNGTPGFVVGEELIPGAPELSALKEKIAAARK